MGNGTDEAAARESVELLAERVRGLPTALDHEVAVIPPIPDLGRLARWIVSGVGGSEFPARFFVGLLQSLGIAARFVPVTAFLGDRPPSADVLVVFSQRLSPNAKIPLRHGDRFAERVVVTSLAPDRDAFLERFRERGGHVLRHAPEEEAGLFLRVLGPAHASLLAVHFGLGIGASRGIPEPSWATKLAGIGPAMARAYERTGQLARDRLAPAAPLGASAIVLTGDDGELTTGLRTKLVEGLGCADVLLCDPCALVHGPLQAFFDEERVVFSLGSEEDHAALELRRRLLQVLDPDRHVVFPIDGTLPRPLVLFEYAAAFDAIVVETLRAHPRDLTRWPCKGRDGPVYDLDGTDTPDPR